MEKYTISRKEWLAFTALIVIFLLSMAFENYEDKTIRRQKTVSKRFELFDACMTRNNYDYTDALCETCWDSTYISFPKTRWERKDDRKARREFKKWAKRKAI